MLGLPLLVDMCDGPPGVPDLIQRHHAERLIDRHGPPRGTAEPMAT